MSHDDDYLYALALQNSLNGGDSDIEEVEFKPPPPSKKPLPRIKRSNPSSNLDEDYLNRTQNLVHPEWETLDPTPDIQSLFVAFNAKFFQGRLNCVTLEWSKRMYSCAGICYSRSNRYGMDVTIRLSEPLLKLRPRKDLVETMLHEMIHAYCFVLHIREGNGGHGPNFKKIMFGINKVAGTNITVYHTFHDEVEIYKQHWWRCNGICQHRSPFFGYVKRTSNRAPGPNDQWWQAHHDACGGIFMKIKGPDPKPTKSASNGKAVKPAAGADLRNYFPTNGDKPVESTSTHPANGGFKGDSKRRRLSTESSANSNFVADPVDQSKKTAGKWVVYDDEVMLKEPTMEIIPLLSDDSDDADAAPPPPERPHHSSSSKPMTTDERQTAIKREILDETVDLRDEDIELIDDDYDDDADVTAATELADTSVIDEFFGEDTLLRDFTRENDVKPSSSNYVPDPEHDIITCPICQDKMQRCLFADHLNGCTGIATKVQTAVNKKKKLLDASVQPARRRPTRKSTNASATNAKEILRKAGYTESDLAHIISDSSADDDSFGEHTTTKASAVITSSPEEDQDTRRYRQRNIFKTTRQCPACTREIEEADMNDHLDECLT